MEYQNDNRLNTTSLEHDDENCTIVTNIENKSYGQSRTLGILEELKQLYRDRLNKIDKAEGDNTQLKLKTYETWVCDLCEQNSILVESVEQLEKEATDRVVMLEDRLQKSSRAALEYMTKLQDYANQVQFLHSQLTSALETEEILRSSVFNYQNDITNLLKLIQRVRESDSWSTAGLTFNEVAYTDIFGSCTKEMKACIKNDVCTSISHYLPHKIYPCCKKEVCICSSPYATQKVYPCCKKEVCICPPYATQKVYPCCKKEVCICSPPYATQKVYPCCKKEVCICNSPCTTQKIKFGCKDEVCVSECKLANLTMKLNEKTEEVIKLQKMLEDKNEMAKDGRAALATEVAVKYDEIKALRQQNKELQERCVQAEMQTHFKGDIIKEMRKDIKQARSKNGNFNRDVEYFGAETNMCTSTPKAHRYTEKAQVMYSSNKTHPSGSYPKDKSARRKQLVDQYTVEQINRPKLTPMNDQISVGKYTKSTTGIITEEVNVVYTPDGKLGDCKCPHDMKFEDLTDVQNEVDNLKYEILKKNDHITSLEKEICNLNGGKTPNDKMYTKQIEGLQEELDAVKAKLVIMESNLKAKEQVITDQREMINIQQDTLKMTQEEIVESQEKLANLERDKKKIKHNSDTKAEELTELEQAVENQQVTIGNLQHALLSTKQQLEQLQGKGQDVSVGGSWGWTHTTKNGHVSKHPVHDV